MSEVPFRATSALKRCIPYARVSTDEQAAKEHNSCETQHVLMGELVARNQREGWFVKETITDAGYSGANLNRPGIQRLLALVKAGEVDVIVVYRRDRLFRDTALSTQMQQFFDLHNVIVASVCEGIHDRSPHAQFTRQMIDAVSEMERKLTLGRVRDAVRQKAARGEWKAGYPPFGYRYTKGSGILQIEENEAPAVRFAFVAISSGISTAEVVRELRSRKVFGRPTVKDLKNDFGRPNPLYIKTDTVVRWIRSQTYRGYVRARNPDVSENADKESSEYWVLFKGKHEALVDEEIWFRANRNLEKRRPKSPNRVPGEARISFLSGITRCGDCGCALVAGRARKLRQDNQPHRYLRCSLHIKAAETSKCNTKNVSVDAAESTVLSFIHELAAGASSAARLQHFRSAKGKDQVGTLKAELARLDHAILDQQKAVSRLIGLVCSGEAQSLQSEFIKSIEEEKLKCNQLSNQRAEVEQQLFEAGAMEASGSEIAEAFKRVASGFAAGDMKARHLLVHRIFDSITIKKLDERLLEAVDFKSGRSFHFVFRIRTTALVTYGTTGTDALLELKRYSPLSFAMTVQIFSNRIRQTISILETSSTVETTRFREVAQTKPTLLRNKQLNHVQKAVRWQSIVAQEGVDQQSLAKREGVSPGTISLHMALLRLPERILSYFRDSHDEALQKPFGLRELLRMVEMSHMDAEAYFMRRIAVPKQGSLDL